MQISTIIDKLNKEQKILLRRVLSLAVADVGTEKSGNHDHDGRPGLVGGSAPSKKGSTKKDTPKKSEKKSPSDYTVNDIMDFIERKNKKENERANQEATTMMSSEEALKRKEKIDNVFAEYEDKGIKQVVKQLQKNGIDITVSKGVEALDTKSVMETLHTMLGENADCNIPIKCFAKGERKIMAVGTEYSDTQYDKLSACKVWFNPKLYADRNKLRIKMMPMYQSGFHPNSTIEGCARHEGLHYALRCYGKVVRDHWSDYPNAEAEYNRYKKEQERKRQNHFSEYGWMSTVVFPKYIMKNVIKELQETGFNVAWDTFENNVKINKAMESLLEYSRYGGNNAKRGEWEEAIAEAESARGSKSDNALSRAIRKSVKKFKEEIASGKGVDFF